MQELFVCKTYIPTDLCIFYILQKGKILHFISFLGEINIFLRSLRSVLPIPTLYSVKWLIFMKTSKRCMNSWMNYSDLQQCHQKTLDVMKMIFCNMYVGKVVIVCYVHVCRKSGYCMLCSCMQEQSNCMLCSLCMQSSICCLHFENHSLEKFFTLDTNESLIRNKIPNVSVGRDPFPCRVEHMVLT